MLVPSNRLLLFTGILGIPLFALLGLAEAPVAAMLGVAVLLLLMVALDAPSAAASLQALKVKLPETIRTSKGRELVMEATLTNPGGRCSWLRVGLGFPEGLDSERPILNPTLKKDLENTRLTWNLKAVERGNHLIHRVHLEGRSRLGLWHARRSLPCKTEFRVYPDLTRERNVLAPLFFRRGVIGIHHVRQIGKGREFEQLREYAPGDSYDDIFWRGTAKRRFPVTKMFQLERTQEVYVAIDASRRSARRLDQLAEQQEPDSWPRRIWNASSRPHSCWLWLPSSRRTNLASSSSPIGCSASSAGGGRSHYNTIRDVLYTLQADPVSPDYEDVFIHIGNRLRHRSLMIFLTDLGEPWLSEQFVEGVSLVARRHVVLTHMLGQKEIAPLFGKGDEIKNDEELYGRLAGQLLWNDLQETTRVLKQRGVHLTSSLQENLVADVVNEYLRVKKRQLI
ncbi:DUF58 domain-containing protein [Verrucomicrobium spinosum]|uniref:DUF58 domain-containing protein n=1 Tax=Verrucomicrobium spinosum TaxID=2736 RepID=UPI0009463E6F|nr:DUF58 domain-containing protein [Verrucomicrobium spinosum]